MKKNGVLIIVVVMLQLFVSCKDPGNKFAGTWKNTNNDRELLIITKSGKDFTIDFRGVKVAAIYDEVSDKLTASHLAITYEFIMDDKAKYLFFNNDKYEKK